MPPSQNQWPFQNAAPGLPTPQSRGAPGMSGGSNSNVGSNFAQTIGGNPAVAAVGAAGGATPLDPSEFPSLSGVGSAIQAQQNHNQAIWSGQRQHTPVQQQQQQQRGSLPPPQQQQNENNNPAAQGLRQQQPSSLDDGFFGAATGNPMDEYRRSQNGVGQLSSNPPPANVDEFPPLGRGGAGEIGGDRRMNMMQAVTGGASGGFGSIASGFPPGIGTNRLASDSLRTNSRPLQSGTNDSSLFSSMNEVSQTPVGSGQSQQPQQPPPPQSQPTTTTTADTTTTTKRNGTSQRNNMTDEEKYGLPGLLDAIKNESNDNFNLAIGHDLTTLGLDLNSSDAIYPTFSGPLSNRSARAMTPDFTLPPCYTVTNVPPISEKLPNFSDETLFYIFYTYCGDILQESAAIELTYRSWRWHKTNRVWMTKDATFPEPMPIDHESERGKYVVFNEKSWARQQVEMVLLYADLDDHISAAPPGSLPGPVGFA